MRNSLLLSLALLLAAPASAEIYRTVDADGNVVFSDVPPRTVLSDGESTAPLSVAPINSYESPEPSNDAVEPQNAAAALDAAYYGRIEVVEPLNDAAIRDNGGNLTVAIALAPRLRGDHRLVLVLDQSPSDAAANGNVFALTNLDRGTHALTARVVDGSGAVIAESAPVSFHMLRAIAPKPQPRSS